MNKGQKISARQSGSAAIGTDRGGKRQAVSISGRGGKKPLDPREYPAARDSRGTASRTEIRRQVANKPAARASQRPAERSSQARTHRTGKRT